MSDRKLVIDMATSATLNDTDRVKLFMDGDSGTWRLFVEDEYERGNVDFSLSNLRQFRDALSNVLNDIERDPDEFNGEVRLTWNDL